MYPHERSLVKRLAGKPFVLLGINSDRDREQLKDTLKTENITLKSWWDAGKIDGPIQTKWQVTQRPAIYVLDEHGVIRDKDVTHDDLDRAVDSLLEKLARRSDVKRDDE